MGGGSLPPVSNARSPRFQGSPGVHSPTYVIQSYSVFCVSQDRYYKAGIKLQVNRWRRLVQRVNFWPQFFLLRCRYMLSSASLLRYLVLLRQEKMHLHLSCHQDDHFTLQKTFIIKGMQQEKYKLAIVAGVFREGVKSKKSHKILLKTKKAVKTTISIIYWEEAKCLCWEKYFWIKRPILHRCLFLFYTDAKISSVSLFPD